MRKSFLLILLFIPLLLAYLARSNSNVSSPVNFKNDEIQNKKTVNSAITNNIEPSTSPSAAFDTEEDDYVPELADFFPSPSEQIAEEPIVLSSIVPSPSDNQPFSISDLKELNDSNFNKNTTNQNSREAPFISDRSSSSNDTSSTASPSPTPSPVGDENLLPLASGQARGYAMLYLMHPNARQTVEQQVDAMIKSNVAELFLAVLTDGTFSRDFDYLADVIKRLSVRSKLKLVLYLTNGPSQRSYGKLPIDAGVNSIDPITYNELIKYDSLTQYDYQSLIVDNLAVVNLNQRLGNSTIIIPMLEDNLDTEAFGVMEGLTQEVFGTNVEIRRNPCGCTYDDNVRSTQFIEKHKLEDIPLLDSGDGYTLDGVGYTLDNSGISSVYSILDQTKNLEYFGLWKFDRQGFQSKSVTQHPDERTYAIPTREEVDKEILILRYGLATISG